MKLLISKTMELSLIVTVFLLTTNIIMSEPIESNSQASSNASTSQAVDKPPANEANQEHEIHQAHHGHHRHNNHRHKFLHKPENSNLNMNSNSLLGLNNDHMHHPYLIKSPQPQIFINQSNNIFILAKFGQTVSLPCVIYRQKNPDLINIHAVWSKLNDKHRPKVLSVGTQQLKPDMRYRVKVFNINENRRQRVPKDSNGNTQAEEVKLEENIDAEKQVDNNGIVQNWQFEIRKLTYEDSGTYQCSLPLVKPLTKNITLQVIPDLVIEPKDRQFRIDEKIIIECKATLKAVDRKSTHYSSNPGKKPVIYWYKENDLMDARTNHVEIMTHTDENEHNLHSVLTINKAKLADSGQYRCVYDDIQEQVQVKVAYQPDFGFKNFLTSSTSRRLTTQSLSNMICKLASVSVPLFLIHFINMF